MKLWILLLPLLLVACGDSPQPNSSSPLSASMLLVDDKAAPEGGEGDHSMLSFNVRLNQAVQQTVTVDWETEGGSATAGDDYQSASGTLNFVPGETQQVVDIVLLGDNTEEPAETFMLRLSHANGAALETPFAKGTIANDDSACNPTLPGDPNPWFQDDRFLLNYSHRGGALEYPENTLYSYKKSVEIGADVLEMDVYETADGELVVIHDDTVDRTTASSGGVSSYTLAELKAMDAAYWFVDERGAVTDAEEASYRFRGVATGDRLPPSGYVPNDFSIPTLEEIMQAFPDVLINIELKPDPDSTGSYETKVADLLKAYGRNDDVIVASFIDVPAALFKIQAPCVSTSVPTGQAALYVVSAQGPLPMAPVVGHHAFQVPTELGIEVVTQDFINDAHAQSVAVHVWTINSCDEMVRLLNLGVDAVMTDRPGLLESVLAQPPGSWSCEGLE